MTAKQRDFDPASERPRRPDCCPVRVDLRQAENLAQDLRRTMRRLRRDLRHCPRCPEQAGCTILETVNRQIDAALTAVLAEWDQSSEAYTP